MQFDIIWVWTVCEFCETFEQRGDLMVAAIVHRSRKNDASQKFALMSKIVRIVYFSSYIDISNEQKFDLLIS